MTNYLLNGNFNVLPPDTQGPIGPTTGKYIDGKWYIGPGTGALLNWSIRPFDAWQTVVPGRPESFLRMTWVKVASSGENQYLPKFRYSFLEQHVYHCRELFGKTVVFGLYLRVLTGPLQVKPVVEVNWSNGDYMLFDCPTVTLQGGVWQEAGGVVALPEIPAGKYMDLNAYVGVALDFIYPAGPTLDVARAVLLPVGENVERRTWELEKLMCGVA